MYVYTNSATSKEPLTEKVRKCMTRNVKASAYASLLGPRKKHQPNTNEAKFVDNDQQIFNFAREDLSKNASTKIPARLLVHQIYWPNFMWKCSGYMLACKRQAGDN